jgi:hypothetical protein
LDVVHKRDKQSCQRGKKIQLRRRRRRRRRRRNATGSRFSGLAKLVTVGCGADERQRDKQRC